MVPNLYPALERQEVVVHTPRHSRSLVELDNDELALVTEAWRQRRAVVPDGYLHVFVNEGAAAGTSLPHSHSQLAWLPQAPPAVAAEACDDVGDCPICKLLTTDRRDRAFSGAYYVDHEMDIDLLCPPTSWAPYQMVAAPAETHESDAFAADAALDSALSLATKGLRRLHSIVGPCPANIWLHNRGHWHLEIVPRLSVHAGLELGAGVYVNTVPPEEAAAALRAAF